jgi:hypothetical protein
MAASMAEPTLSPQQAAQALADLAGFEQALTARVGALTGMVWGVVSAAIFVTYGVAGELSPMWLMGFLWLPWTAAGVAITVAAWKLHAVSLRRPHNTKASWLWSLGFAALFLAAITLLHVLGLADDQGAFPYMLVVNGLVALIIAGKVGRLHGLRASVPMAVAGVAIIAGAFLLSAAGLPSVGLAFASAALAGTAFLGGSLVSFLRG